MKGSVAEQLQNVIYTLMCLHSKKEIYWEGEQERKSKSRCKQEACASGCIGVRLPRVGESKKYKFQQ